MLQHLKISKISFGMLLLLKIAEQCFEIFSQLFVKEIQSESVSKNYWFTLNFASSVSTIVASNCFFSLACFTKISAQTMSLVH